MEVVSNMARPKKDNVPVSLRIEKELFDRLNQFCEDSGQPKTVAMERALTMYIDDYYEKQEIIRNIE
jgi:predicted DNA-binding protein